MSDREQADSVDWERELAEAGWKPAGVCLYRAPCGCLFRGPWWAWKNMTGTHVANHFAANPTTDRVGGK